MVFFHFLLFQSKKQQSIIFVGATLLCISSLVSAQLSYHLDANTNSYTLQTPNSQQSFTRYFNGQPGAVNSIKATRAHPIQTAQSQQQPQQQVIFQWIFFLSFSAIDFGRLSLLILIIFIIVIFPLQTFKWFYRSFY